MKKQFLECGKIVAVQGIKGEVRVQPWCDTPEFLLDFPVLYLNKGQTSRTVKRAYVRKNTVVLKFEGTDTPEDAAALRGQIIYVRRQDVKLAPGEYFVQDLLGCRVLDVDTGADYGEIYDVRATGANDVYYLRDSAGIERLVPVIPQVVLERDVDAGIVKIRPLEGLFDA